MSRPLVLISLALASLAAIASLALFASRPSAEGAAVPRSVAPDATESGALTAGASAEPEAQPRTRVGTESAAESSSVHVIRGRVVDESGAPVAGAQLSASTRPRGDTGWPAADNWTAVSDHAGRFRIRGLAPGRVRVQAMSERYALSVTELDWANRTDIRVPDVVLTRGIVLHGVVHDPDGNPIEGASLRLLVRRVRGAVVVSGADGSFAMPAIEAGAWEMRVTAAGCADRGFQGTTSTVEAERPLDFTLFRMAPISGKVVDHEGNGVADATMFASFVRDGSGAERPPLGSAGYAFAQTDDAGRFSLSVPASGKGCTLYSVVPRMKRTGAAVPLAAAVEVCAGTSDVVFRCAAPAFVAVSVTSEDGQPLVPDSVVIHVKPVGPNIDLSETKRVRTEDGRISLGPVPLTAEAETTLYFKRTGYEVTTAECTLGPGRTVAVPAVVMVRKAALMVHVVAADDRRPIEGVHVCARPTFAAGGSYESVDGSIRASTSADGIARLAVTRGHGYLVSAFCASYAIPDPRTVTTESAGETTLELEMTRGGRLVVEACDTSGEALRGTAIELAHDESDPRIVAVYSEVDDLGTRRTDERGICAFEGLFAGNHDVRVAGEPAWTRVRIAEGEERRVRLVVPRRTRLGGRVSMNGGALASAWVVALELPTEAERGFNKIERGRLQCTDIRGRFDMGACRCTTYRLLVFSAQLALPHRTELSLAPNDRPVAIEIQSSELTGRIVDAEGLAVTNARVAWTRPGRALRNAESRLRLRETARPPDPPECELSLPVAVDAQGRFALRAGMTTDATVLAVCAPGRCGLVIPVAGPGARLGDIVLPRGGVISVEADAPLPPEGVRWRVVPAADTRGFEDGDHWPRAWPVRVEGLCPGAWRFDLLRRLQEDDDAPLSSHSCEVREGEETHIVLKW